MNARTIIRSLGGAAALADQLSSKTGIAVTPKRASNWSKRGVPAEFRAAVARMLKEAGIEVPDGFCPGVEFIIGPADFHELPPLSADDAGKLAPALRLVPKGTRS